MTTLRCCPICESNSNKLLYRQSFADITSVSFLKGYDVVVCDICGFTFADNIPSQEAFDHYYEKQSKYERTSHNMDLPMYDVLKNGLMFINQYVNNKNISILEIGCGSGDFLKYLKDNGFINLAAIEPSQRLADTLRQDFGINAMAGSISNPRSKGTFDLVILLTVLEHIVDLKGAIYNISLLMHDGGLLFIRVPNVYQFHDFDDSPFQQFSPEHINFFSIISVCNLMGDFEFTLLGQQEIPLRESDKSILPMINLMFQKRKGVSKHVRQYDAASQTQLIKYIELSNAKDKSIEDKIYPFVISQEPIVVWGVGTHTLRLLELGVLKQCNIIAFIDSNDHYEGGVFNNIPVFLPKELFKYQNKILISSKVFQSEISHFIKNVLKAPNDLILLYN